MTETLIFGGHGKIALLAAPLLTDAGHHVTSVIRKDEQVADVEATGATALVLDMESASHDQLVDALRGKDAVVFSAGAGGGNPARTRAVDYEAAVATMRAAEAAGVARYVMVSYLGASLDHGLDVDDDFYPYAQAKAEADEVLRGTSLDWTILAPSLLTEHEGTGRVTVNPDLDTDDAPASETSRANVAAAI
ncbi:MAG: SDR family oxidoreductase, partial [Micrococcus sp.]|nr:SDR family oxidoreductase [Micrococcus sp.]